MYNAQRGHWIHYRVLDLKHRESFPKAEERIHLAGVAVDFAVDVDSSCRLWKKHFAQKEGRTCLTKLEDNKECDRNHSHHRFDFHGGLFDDLTKLTGNSAALGSPALSW